MKHEKPVKSKTEHFDKAVILPVTVPAEKKIKARVPRIRECKLAPQSLETKTAPVVVRTSHVRSFYQTQSQARTTQTMGGKGTVDGIWLNSVSMVPWPVRITDPPVEVVAAETSDRCNNAIDPQCTILSGILEPTRGGGGMSAGISFPTMSQKYWPRYRA